MVNTQREYREGNLVDAVESIAYPLAEAVGGTFMVAQVAAGPISKAGSSKEGVGQYFGGGPERGG